MKRQRKFRCRLKAAGEGSQDSPLLAPVTAQRAQGRRTEGGTVMADERCGNCSASSATRRSAQSRKEEGVAPSSFSLDRSGHVLAHSIARSSGHLDLYNEVLAMIMRADLGDRLFPASMTQTQIDLTVPIRFSLR